MALRVPQGFIVTSREAIDNRLVLTKKQMREINDGWMPEAYLALCPVAEEGMTNPDGENLYKIYIYHRDYEWDDETGRFRAYAGDYNDLANIPFINGVPVQGSEGDGLTYKLQNKLYAITSEGKLDRNYISVGPGIEIDNATWDSEHLSGIRVRFDGDTIKSDSENNLYIDLSALFAEGDAIEIDLPAGSRKATLNVLFDDETIHLDNSELNIHFRESEGVGLDDGEFYVKIDKKTIKYDSEGRLYALPEPLKDGIATSIRHKTELWDSEAIDLVYDSEKGLAVDPTNHLYIKLNNEKALKFDNDGNIMVKVDGSTVHIDSERGLELHLRIDEGFDVDSEGYLFIKIDDNSIHYNPITGNLEVRPAENFGLSITSEGAAGGPGNLYIKIDGKTIHYDDDQGWGQGYLEIRYDSERAIDVNNGTFYIKVDKKTVFFNSEGEIKINPDPRRSFHVSEGLLYVDVDGDTVRHKGGKLEAKKVVAGKAIRLNDSEGGDVVVNVVVDDNTIHIDSEGGQTKLALHLSTSEGIGVHYGKLYTEIDNATIVYNNSGQLKLPLDYTTIILNSEGKIHNNIDDNTLIYSTSERVVRVEVPHLVLLGNNADFDSERYWRIRHDSELEARADNIEDHLFFTDSDGNIITITSSELSGPGPGEVVWNVYQDKIDQLKDWDESHYTYMDGTKKVYIPANWSNYSQVYGVSNTDAVIKPKMAHVSKVDRDRWNRVVGKQNKLILEDTTNNTHYKNALLLYANGSHDTPLACATSEISLRVDNDSICIREPSEGGYLELYADGYIHRPPHTADLLVVTDSDGNPYWTSADRFGKIDLIDITDGTRTKTLPVVNKKVTIPVTDGLILKSGTSEIAHANAVTPQTRAANHVLIPVGTDAQGHIIDGTTATVANGLRELTFYDRSNNAGAYVITSQPWAIIADPTNVTNTTNVSLKVAGFDGNAAAGHKYDNATLKVDANGLSGNYQIVPQKTGKRTTSEGLLEIVNNKVNFLPSFLNRLVLSDYAKNAIDSEGLRDDHYYPTINLLKTELDAKQDVLHPILPAVITSEGDSEGPNKLYVLYDNDSIKLNNNGELVTKDVYLATLPGIPLSDIVPTDANSENPMTTEGWVQDSISSNLGRFVGNFTSEGALPDRSEVPTLARNDYAFVTIPVYDSEGNVEYLYYRYKYVDDTSETGHWQFEYQVSGSTFTYKQLLALNSDWNLQLTNTAKAHFNNADIHITAAERTKWNNKQDKLTAGDHINATSLAANTIKVDAQSSVVDAATYDSKLATIGAIKGYFKKKQNAVAANTGTIDTSATYIVASIAQDAQGVITPTRVAFDYDKLSSRPTINGSTITGALLANNGITYDTATKAIKHSNSVTANTTSGLKYFTYDAQGHVTASVNKTLGRGINDQSNVIGHSNSVTAATNVGQTANKIPYFSYDAQGHITASDTKDQYPTLTGNAGKVLAVNTAANGVYWLALPEGVTYSAGTGLALSGTTFNHSNSVAANTTSGLKYFTYDAQGHVTAGINKTLGRGIDDQSNVIGHSNSVTANTTSGLKYFTYDAQGHVTAGVNKTLGRGISDSSNIIGHSNTAITASTTQSLRAFAVDAYGHTTAYTAKTLGRGIDDQSNVIGHSNTAITAQTTAIGGWNTTAAVNGGFYLAKGIKHDTYGHLTAQVTADTVVTGDRGIRVNSSTKKIEHTNDVLNGAKTDYSKTGIKVPYFSYDAYGHLTATGEKDIFPALAGNAGKVLKVNSSSNGLEWGVGGGGGGGGNYNFTGKNGITVTTDSENVTIAGYTAGDNIIINGSLISATAGAPPFVNITGDAKSNSNLNAYLTALENKDTELDSKKQNKLVAGAGITLTNSGDTTTISSSYEASDSIGIVNNKFEVTSPINGGNHVIVEGDWDATGHTISVPAVTTFTTGDRTKLPEWGLILDNFKKIQAAVNDPTASTTTSTTFIDTISQDTQGKITVTKKTLPPYPTVGNGSLVIQLNGVDKGRFTANQSTNTVVNLQPAWDDISGKPATSTPLNGKLTLSDVVVPSRSKEFTANQGTNVTLELHGTDVYLERW